MASTVQQCLTQQHNTGQKNLKINKSGILILHKLISSEGKCLDCMLSKQTIALTILYYKCSTDSIIQNKVYLTRTVGDQMED